MKKKDLPATSAPQNNQSTAFNALRSREIKRRGFLKSLSMAGAAASAGVLLSTELLADERNRSGSLTKGDIAILRFLAAAEILESDLWIQYWELGGVQSDEFGKPTGGNELYASALQILDGDMSQYITDNTDDEISHFEFINAYLKSKGAPAVSLEKFRTLPGSQATGANKSQLRLTNLMELNIDTSFWTRYRIENENPDLDPHFNFPQAANIANRTAIPRTDADLEGPASIEPLNIPDHLKAIAFTAGFHFAYIEQGGTTIYPSLAQRVTNPEVLRILLSIGGTEIAHFQTWQDKAGNALALTDTDPVTGSTVTFKDLTSDQPESLQSNLIMPEPCVFLSRKFPKCSIIRPTETKGAAMSVVSSFAADGLFKGQSPQFFEFLRDLAEDADAARREL